MYFTSVPCISESILVRIVCFVGLGDVSTVQVIAPTLYREENNRTVLGPDSI